MPFKNVLEKAPSWKKQTALDFITSVQATGATAKLPGGKGRDLTTRVAVGERITLQRPLEWHAHQQPSLPRY